MPDDGLDRSCQVMDLGVLEYGRALDLQRSIHARVVAGEIPGALISLEHPRVITFGNRSDDQYLLSSQERLDALGIALYASDRGGEVTAHNEGQLVIYPILRQRPELMPKRFVWCLEQAVIDCLAAFGIAATRHDLHPGVWLGDAKICALGIRILQRVSMHGLALNITNDLKIFDHIVPCGIKAHGVTRMLDWAPGIRLSDVRAQLLASLADRLGLKLAHEVQGGLPRAGGSRMIRDVFANPEVVER